MPIEILHTLEQSGLFLPAIFLLGLIVGSFLNVVIYRLPKHMEAELKAACQALQTSTDETQQPPANNRWFGLGFLIHPASHCPHCKHPIRAWENLPVISFLLQKGRCRYCQQKISWQYPIVELLTALFSLAVAWHFGPTPIMLGALLLTWGLLAMSVIDIQHQLLPDVLTLPLLWLGIIINLHQGFTDIASSVYGAVAGYLFLWLLFHVFLLLTGKEGMGYGDFKLFALFGAWLGWQFLPQILLISAVVGALSGLAMIAFLGRDKAIPIPFGPYLAAAGWIALLWGEEINHGYLQFAGIQ